MNKAFKFFFILPWLLIACVSPTAKMASRISEFKKKYPDHIGSYHFKDQKMEFAWSGDPNKTPLIFIHGSPGDWTGWVEFLLDEDLQKKFHVITIDRPGYGGSGLGHTETSLQKQGEAIMAVLEFNKSGKKAILVGHSYGGAVIAQIAMDQPEKTSGLIFVASSLDPKLEATKWYQYPASWWPIRVLIPKALRVCNEEIFALKAELERIEPRWGEIQAAVATIQGDVDELVPKANQDFLLLKIPAKQIKYKKSVFDMNHFVPWQRPELIREAIDVIGPFYF